MKIYLFIVTLFVLIINNCLFSKEFKLNTVDPQKLLEESPQSLLIYSKLEKEFTPLQETVKIKYKELQSKKDSFMRNKEILNEKEKIIKEKEITKIQQDYQKYSQELEIKYRDKEKSELEKFNKVLDKVIKKIVKEEEIDIILPNQIILYSNDNLDITNKILYEMKKIHIKD